MKWSHSHTLTAGLALIVVTNAVALIAAAYNRGGIPESTLRLTERELELPYRETWGGENSGLSLALAWRVRGPDKVGREAYDGVWGRWSPAAWLDARKLEQVGLAVPPQAMSGAERRRYRDPEAKEVFLVLELDGSGYRAAVQRARERAEAAAAQAARDSANTVLKNRAEFAGKQLREEETGGSRLFVVDAGLDADALRVRYTDRARYAVVKGRVRAPAPGIALRLGYVDALAVGQINVPVAYRSVFEGASRTAYRPAQPGAEARFEATVAFGKRLEPWLAAASRRP